MNAILENIVSPLVRRVGTAIAVWLVAKGADNALVDQLVNAASAGVLLAVDLLLARIYRKSVVSKTAHALGLGGFIDPGAPFVPRGSSREPYDWGDR